MATHITQSLNDETGQAVLAVKGEMMLEDALLLERIATGMLRYDEGPIIIDLADLDFLDSESAVVLKRLSDDKHFRIEGMEIFLQSVIDAAERSGSLAD